MSSKKGGKKKQISSNWLSIASSVGAKKKLSVAPKAEKRQRPPGEPPSKQHGHVIVESKRRPGGGEGIKIAPSVMQLGRYILRGIDTSKPAPRMTQHLALDCEMVGVGPKDRSVLAQICVVNYDCEVIYSTYVQPQERVADYRTWVSGVKPEHLKRAPTFAQVQREIGILTEGRVIVGHGLSNDLAVLMLKHPRRSIRDTAKFPPFQWMRGGQRRPKRLMQLAQEYLNMKIQSGEHDPAEDAIAPMRLYKYASRQWEAWLKTGMKGDPEPVSMAEGVAEKRAEKREKRDKKKEGRWEELERQRQARLLSLGADKARALARSTTGAPTVGSIAPPALAVMPDTDLTSCVDAAARSADRALHSNLPVLAAAPAVTKRLHQGTRTRAEASVSAPVSASMHAEDAGSAVLGRADLEHPQSRSDTSATSGKHGTRGASSSDGGNRVGKGVETESGNGGGARGKKRKRDKAFESVVVDKRLPFKGIQAGRVIGKQRQEERKKARLGNRGDTASASSNKV